MTPEPAAVAERLVQFRSDGLSLSPAAYARVLERLSRNDAITADEFTRGGAVGILEERMAAALGKEAAVFLPSGTLANHLALRRLAQRGRRVLVQRESHIYCDSGDCVQRLSGLVLAPLASGRAGFTLEEVMDEVGRAEDGRVTTPVAVISIESPVRRAAGAVFDFAEMQRIAAFALERGIALHLDGARLFLGAAYTGIAPAACAALFDTVYVSLYKYFNAAGGAILAGPRALLADLYEERRMFGGSLRQAWPLAAVALHFLDGFEARFAQAVAVAESLFDALAGHPSCRVERPAGATNVTHLHVCGRVAASLPERLRPAAIAIAPALSTTAESATFELHTNETILRRPVAETIAAFLEAVDLAE
jgi:threonine aldolase